jgi:NAD+ synthase
MAVRDLRVPDLVYPDVVREIVAFIKRTVETAGVQGVVVGLSGGVDSSLVVTLCARALGRERVLGVLMPLSFTPSADTEDAEHLAKWLGIDAITVDIQPLSDAFSATLGLDPGDPRQRLPLANVRARIRMVLLYYFANLRHCLVAGTSDRSELLIGFFTKYGDGGTDFLPIAHLYKTQVRRLAEYLGVPKRIAHKPSSPHLYPDHLARDEIPLDYAQLDPVLVGLFDHELSPVEVSRATAVPLARVTETLRRYDATGHKRAFPPTVKRRR